MQYLTTDALGRVTTYAYNALGQQISVTQPIPATGGTHPVTTYTYDANGDVLTETDPLGHVTSFAYNALGQQISVTQPIPATGGTHPVTTYTYDANGDVLTVTDPLGRVTTYTYDSLGQQITVKNSVTSGTAPVTTSVYDANGNLLLQTDPLGRTTYYIYDHLNRPTSVIEPSLSAASAPFVSLTSYDAAGEVTSTTDTAGLVTYYQYDGLGRQVMTSEPIAGGGSTFVAQTSVYDAVGNLLSQSDDLGDTTSYGYDHLYRQISQTDADSNVTSYTYDAVGNQTSLTDPDGNTTTFTYDNLNRQVGQSRSTYESGASTSSVAVSETMAYDAAGNLTSETNYDGQTVYYQYDNLNRETKELWGSLTSPSATFTYTLDADGEQTAVVSAGSVGATTEVQAYNTLGDMTNDTFSGNGYAHGMNLGHAFDLDGNVVSSALTLGTGTDYSNAYTYDNLNRETSVTQTSVTGGDAVAPKRVNLTYNADSQLSTITDYNDSTGTTVVDTGAYAYDTAGRLTGLTYTAQGSTIAGYTWGWTNANQIQSFINSQHTNENLNYTYDAAGQLVSATSPTGSGTTGSEGYTYDSNGNRVASSAASATSNYTTGANNKTVSDGTYTYQYDGEGNLVKQTTIATGAYTTYAYDFHERLTTVTSYTSANAVTQTVAYTYDSFDRRIAEAVTAAGVTTTTKFVYDGQNVIVTFNGTNALTNRYLDGPGVDQVFADEQFTPTTAGQMPTAPGTVIWPLVDNLGTDRDLVEYSAGTTSVADHLAYSGFGAVTSETNPAVSYLFGYTGFVRDLATGLDHSDSRDYNPADGVWTQEDPIGFAAQDPNLNRYVANDSVSKRDPSGRFWEVSSFGFWLHTLLEYAIYKEGEHGNTIEHIDDRWARAVGRQPEIAHLENEAINTAIQNALIQVPPNFPVGGTTSTGFQKTLQHSLKNGDGIAFWLGTGQLSYRGTVTVHWARTIIDGKVGVCPVRVSVDSKWRWRDVINANSGNLDKFIESNGGYQGMMNKLSDSPFTFGLTTTLVGGVSGLEDIVHEIHDELLSGGFPVLYEWTIKR